MSLSTCYPYNLFTLYSCTVQASKHLGHSTKQVPVLSFKKAWNILTYKMFLRLKKIININVHYRSKDFFVFERSLLCRSNGSINE